MFCILLVSDEFLQSTKSTKRQRTNSANTRTDVLSDINGLEEDIPLLPIVYAVQYRRVLRNIPQDIPYVPVTTENGSRVYLRILQKKKKQGAEEEDEDEPIRLISTEGGSNRKLYSDWETIKTDARRLVLRKITKIVMLYLILVITLCRKKSFIKALLLLLTMKM
jgi:hypothetical protein